MDGPRSRDARGSTSFFGKFLLRFIGIGVCLFNVATLAKCVASCCASFFSLVLFRLVITAVKAVTAVA